MPKKSTDTLFKLIKSLSKHEKRQITMHLINQNDSKPPLYAKLFKWMSISKVYNEKQILKDIPEIKPSQLPNQKVYLQEYILNQLQMFKSNKDPGSKVKQGLDRVNILFGKGMYKQSLNLLNSLKKIAKQYDLFLYLLSILDWETKLSIVSIDQKLSLGDYKNPKKRADQIFDEKAAYLKKYQTQTELEYLRHHVFISIRQDRFTRKEFDRVNDLDLLSHPILNKNIPMDGFKIPQLYHSLLGIYFITLGEYEKSYIHFESLLNLIRNNKHINIIEPQAKKIALYNFILNSGRSHKYDDLYFKAMDELKAEIKKTHSKPIDYYCLKLIYYSSTGKFETGKSYADQITKEIDDNFEFQNIYIQMDLYFDLMYIYFGYGDYKKAGYWLDKFLNTASAQQIIDLYAISRLIEIIIHYELKNYTILEPLIRSYYRFLHKSNRIYKFESIMLDFFKQILRNPDEKKLEIILSNYQSKLELLKKNKYEKRVFEYFDFSAWIESKIQNIQFSQLVKKEYNKSIGKKAD